MLIGDVIFDAHVADYVDGGMQMFICDGRAINRITYATLFALCGVAYGPGDGVTTFNIPQFGFSGGMTGRSPIGASPAGGYALGAQGGVELHVHTVIGVSIDHETLQPTSPAAGSSNQYLAGAVPAAADNHAHDATIAPGTILHALSNPDNANHITPVLAAGIFIRVL